MKHHERAVRSSLVLAIALGGACFDPSSMTGDPVGDETSSSGESSTTEGSSTSEHEGDETATEATADSTGDDASACVLDESVLDACTLQ